MRGRSYSYSPSPPRYRSKSYRSPSPRYKSRSYRTPSPRYRSRSFRSPSPKGRYGGRARDLPTSLLVRNLRCDCRPEDLRGPFGEFGPLKDIYLPRDYYTGERRGFGFVQYLDPDDAAEAKYQMDGQILLGRELIVVFAEENRKKPSEMRARERFRGRSYDRRGSLVGYSHSPRRGSPSSYSPSPRRDRYSRSISRGERRYGSYGCSGSPVWSPSPSPSTSPVGY